MPPAPTTKDPKAPPRQAEPEVDQIAEKNAALAQAWEQMGIFKKIPITKEVLVKMANLEGMPLSGADVIETQQGFRLYINNVGAKCLRDKYLTQQDRELSGRSVDILEKLPNQNADATLDKQQGRVYFKITTRIKSPEYVKLIDAVCAGKMSAADAKIILDDDERRNTYHTFSAFSYATEKFQTNRVPEHIIKKGITQCHRRADLEIANQSVLPADEEPTDANFLAKADDILKEAQTGSGGASALTPASVKPVAPTLPPPAKADVAPAATPTAAATPGSGVEGKAAPTGGEDLTAKISALNSIFEAAKVSRFDRQKWMQDHKFPFSKKELTAEVLDKAIKAATEQYTPSAAQEVKQEPPKQAEKPAEDPERTKALSRIFGMREKSGFVDEDTLRAWVKQVNGKGLSEMTATEMAPVIERISEFATFLANHTKWSFGSTLELMAYVQDSGGKSLHTMTTAEITKLATDIAEVM